MVADRLSAQRGVTLRALLIGLLAAAAINVEVAYVEYVLHASRLTLSHFPMGTLIVFLGVVVLLNALLRPRLSPPELLVILAMGLAAGTIPSVGLTGYFLGVLASPYYFASPENQWAEYFHPHIPSWMAPRNQDGAIDRLFEGLPEGASIPWGVWVVPLLWWGGLIAAFVGVSVCLAVIFRRQWSEHERLVYPLLRPALEMAHGSDASGCLPAFMRGRIFWSGFLLAFGILCWNMISHFVPGFPQVPNIQWGPWVFFQRPFPGVWTRINMFTISFAYFANVDVLFSLWFFDLMFILRSGILNRFGLNASTPYHGSATYVWIDLGAFFAFVAWGIWAARRHLKAVFSQALRPGGACDDGEEMVSYRTAVLGLCFGLVFIAFWFHRAGMEAGLACLFTAVTLLLHLGVSRLVADVGLVFISVPVGAPEILVYTLGSRNLSRSALTAFAASNALTAYGKGLFLPASVHAARIGDSCPPGDRRRLLTGVLLAFLAGAVTSVVYTLYLGYTQGAYNFNDFPFSRYSQAGFSTALAQMRNPEPPDAERMFLFGTGALVMSALTILRYRLTWWPIHPIGFAIASSGTYVRYTVFSVFLAWAIKALILRLGGVTLYRRYRPFFLGVLTGYTSGIALSILADAIWFPGAGHIIHGY
jgi:hypothetical protein